MVRASPIPGSIMTSNHLMTSEVNGTYLQLAAKSMQLPAANRISQRVTNKKEKRKKNFFFWSASRMFAWCGVCAKLW